MYKEKLDPGYEKHMNNEQAGLEYEFSINIQVKHGLRLWAYFFKAMDQLDHVTKLYIYAFM